MVENCLSGYNSCMFAYGQVYHRRGFLDLLFCYELLCIGVFLLKLRLIFADG